MESERFSTKRLYRSSSNRILNGVCSGLSDYFHIDVSFVRFLFIIFAFLSLSSLLLYILFSAVVPLERSSDASTQEEAEEKNENSIAIVASVFLILGAILLINYFNIPLFINIWSISFVISLAIFLISFGLILSYLIYLRHEFSFNLKNLKRSRSDRVVSGLLGAIAELFEIDSHFLRIIVLSISIFLIKLLALFVVLYLLATILIPYET